MENISTIGFNDLAESKEFRQFFDIIRELTGILVGLATPDGTQAKVLFREEHHSPLCRLIHGHPGGYKACQLTDQMHLQQAVRRKQAIHYLCHAGLVDFMVPIYVNGRHVATMNCGQVLPEPPSEKGFRQLRRKLKHLQFPPKVLRAAYYKTPHYSGEKIKTIIRLFSFFAEYFGEIGWRLKQRDQKDFLPIQRAQQFIHDHFQESITLPAIARTAGLSPAYFSSLFHHRTGTTVMAYLQLIRINAAKELLTQTSERITDIAFDVGFNNLTHFNRIFRKVAHCSPRKYRKTTGILAKANKEHVSS